MREIKYQFYNAIDKVMVEWLVAKIMFAELLDSRHYIPRQFTGLKDRNGVEIYEGDIVCDDLLGICQVKYNEIHAAFKVLHKNNRTAKWFVDYLPNEFKYLRVIGNIHENHELLKG